MKLLIFLFMFLVVGGFFIIGEEKLFLREKNNRDLFMNTYLGWFASVFENAKTITGQVFHLDWLPGEKEGT